EARQGKLGHYGVAHHHAELGGADLRPVPRDRHQPQPAVIVGHVERDGGATLPVELDDAGEERDQLYLRRRAAPAEPGFVAASAELAAAASSAIDELAIEIAELEAEAALAEEPGLRRRRSKIGELEHALVDRRQSDERRLPRGGATHLERDR